MNYEMVELIDLQGPYAGQLRKYASYAVEHAVSHGFARYPDKDVDVVAGALPEDFPARDALEALGIVRLEDVPRSVEELKKLPKIGKGRAEKILAAAQELE